MTTSKDWTEKYRPDTLSDVVGHKDIIQNLKSKVATRDVQSMMFAGPPGVGKTTSSIALAKDLYGEDWEYYFLELNASDERGIDVVRDRIKEFSKTGYGAYDFRIVFLDESDSLTDQAQSALRRTIEQHSSAVRFIFSCNYPSQIIEAIQSRCTVFNFTPVEDEEIKKFMNKIITNEEMEMTEDAADYVTFVADGDVRKSVSLLQVLSSIDGVIEEEDVEDITPAAHPDDVQRMMRLATLGEFEKSIDKFIEMNREKGVDPISIIDSIHKSIWDLELDDEDTVRIMQRVGETDWRIREGGNPRIQMEAMLADITLKTQ